MVVGSAFLSDSEEGIPLQAGQWGVVLFRDDEGDATIRFFHHPREQWVYRENLDKLRRAADVFSEGDASRDEFKRQFKLRCPEA